MLQLWLLFRYCESIQINQLSEGKIILIYKIRQYGQACKTTCIQREWLQVSNRATLNSACATTKAEVCKQTADVVLFNHSMKVHTSCF